jgi:outer membrane protein assembly factor BamB
MFSPNSSYFIYDGSSPVVGADGTVFVGIHQGNVYALDNATGSVRWQIETVAVDTSPILGADGTLLLATSGYVQALNSSTGELRWRERSLAGGIALGENGILFVAGTAGYTDGVSARNSSTGALIWSYDDAYGVFYRNAPCIGINNTVVFSGIGRVIALDGASGALHWSFSPRGPDSGSFLTPPAIGRDGTVYIVSESSAIGTLLALDGSVGARLWGFKIGYQSGRPTYDQAYSPAIGANGEVYIGCKQNGAYALCVVDGVTGELLLRYQERESCKVRNTPAISADGTVFIGWTCDTFSALKLDFTPSSGRSGATTSSLSAGALVGICVSAVGLAIAIGVGMHWALKRRCTAMVSSFCGGGMNIQEMSAAGPRSYSLIWTPSHAGSLPVVTHTKRIIGVGWYSEFVDISESHTPFPRPAGSPESHSFTSRQSSSSSDSEDGKSSDASLPKQKRRARSAPHGASSRCAASLECLSAASLECLNNQSAAGFLLQLL